MYDKLIPKANSVDTKIPTTSGLVDKYSKHLPLMGWSRRAITTQKLKGLKTSECCCFQYLNHIYWSQIPDNTYLVTKAALNTKAIEVESKILGIT